MSRMGDLGHDYSGRLRNRLTGLPGLDAARARLAEWVENSDKPDQSVHIHAMLIGLKRFDAVNLAYGAAAGDGALAELAQRISHFAADELDGPWFAGHGGGAKFLLVANEACSRERWQLVGEQLAQAIARPFVLPSGVLRLSPRIALLRGLEGEGVESMLDRLSHAFAKAKMQEGKRLAWAEGEATPPGRSSAKLEADLLSAIDGDEIEVLFQPQFSLASDDLTGAEALARWNHPELGRVGAAALFSIAERTDQVAPLSRHIARKALAEARQWSGHLRLSLNVTPADLATSNYASQILDIIKATAFPLRQLTLEVTEQALVQDVEQAAQMMAELCAQGIRIALDDFGAGFCNFRYLKVLPLHYLKLDRSMLEGITSDRRDLAVLRAIVAMASALDIEVIAEGIESEDQRACVAAEGCSYYQGFLRAQPMSTAEFNKLASS